MDRPGHKFYSPEKASIILDDSEITAKIIVGDNESEGRYTIVDSVWKLGFVVPDHYHKKHFEVFYLLSGSAEWTVNGETHELKPGDAVYIPANSVHNAKQLGKEPTKFLLIYSPGDHETHYEQKAAYTEEERNKPEIKKQLRKLSDFNVP